MRHDLFNPPRMGTRKGNDWSDEKVQTRQHKPLKGKNMPGDIEATYSVKIVLREQPTRAIRNAEPLTGVSLAKSIEQMLVDTTDYNADEITVRVERTDK